VLPLAPNALALPILTFLNSILVARAAGVTAETAEKRRVAIASLQKQQLYLCFHKNLSFLMCFCFVFFSALGQIAGLQPPTTGLGFQRFQEFVQLFWNYSVKSRRA
jgi:hypothetical protein